MANALGSNLDSNVTKVTNPVAVIRIIPVYHFSSLPCELILMLFDNVKTRITYRIFLKPYVFI